MSTASIARFCPNGDHDGFEAPVTRFVRAVHHRDVYVTHWCGYCCEGYVARKLREGWTVTIMPLAPINRLTGGTT